MGIHSKYTEHIHKFKYRQGNRRTGEHPRVVLSIHNLTFVANHQRSQIINIDKKMKSTARKKSGLAVLVPI